MKYQEIVAEMAALKARIVELEHAIPDDIRESLFEKQLAGWQPGVAEGVFEGVKGDEVVLFHKAEFARYLALGYQICQYKYKDGDKRIDEFLEYRHRGREIERPEEVISDWLAVTRYDRNGIKYDLDENGYIIKVRQIGRLQRMLKESGRPMSKRKAHLLLVGKVKGVRLPGEKIEEE